MRVDIGSLLRLTVLLSMGALIIAPIVAAVLGGFKTAAELRQNPFGPPEEWRSEYYAAIITNADFWSYLGNSVVISVATVALTVIASAMAAFSFSHIRFFGSRFLLAYILCGMMFPLAAAAVPLFLKVRDLGLLDSHWGVILPQAAFGLGFSTLLFKAFFDEMPKELFEAAQIDRCGYAKFFFTFTLPLSMPVLATVATFVFVSSWNEFLLPLIVLNEAESYPWTLGMMQYRGEYLVEWNRVLAFVTLTLIPVIVFFLAAQRFLVSGLSTRIDQD